MLIFLRRKRHENKTKYTLKNSSSKLYQLYASYLSVICEGNK